MVIQAALILLALSVALTAILVARLWLRVRTAEKTCTAIWSAVEAHARRLDTQWSAVDENAQEFARHRAVQHVCWAAQKGANDKQAEAITRLAYLVQEIIDMETGEQGEVVFIAPPTSRDN